MRKLSRKGLLKKLDDVFGDYIKFRDGKCVTCGDTESPDCSHLIKKSRGNFLRWHPDNAYRQCRKCHMNHHNTSEIPLVLYAIKILGEKRIEEMKIEATTITHFKDYQLEEMISYWQGKLSELQNRVEGGK